MKTNTLKPIDVNRKTLAHRALRWIAIDAVLGVASGAIFGIVFGIIGLLLAAESWSIISVASYFALCGAAAGALVGACVVVLEGEDAPERMRMLPSTALPKITPVVATVIGPTSPLDQSSERPPRNRLLALDRRGQTPRESMNPSRN